MCFGSFFFFFQKAGSQLFFRFFCLLLVVFFFFAATKVYSCSCRCVSATALRPCLARQRRSVRIESGPVNASTSGVCKGCVHCCVTNGRKTWERDRVAAKTEPVNGNDRPADCRLRVEEVGWRQFCRHTVFNRCQVSTSLALHCGYVNGFSRSKNKTKKSN